MCVCVQGRWAELHDLESLAPSLCDAFFCEKYFSPKDASSDAGSPAHDLSRASTMREVFDFCDSRKDLCFRLIHDLFQGVRGVHAHANTPKTNSKNNNNKNNPDGPTIVDIRCREFLEKEEAFHSLAIEEAKGLEQLEPYLETFRYCLVAGLMPSELPAGEMAAMVWTLRCRVLMSKGKVNTLKNIEQHPLGVNGNIFPFRERQGVTHRLLTDAAAVPFNSHLNSHFNSNNFNFDNFSSNNFNAHHLPLDLSAAAGAIGLGSPTAAIGRTNGFIAPPSLFFGPAHAPSSPTAALYGGCFAKATEQEHFFAVV